jgi:hypothetical protein
MSSLDTLLEAMASSTQFYKNLVNLHYLMRKEHLLFFTRSNTVAYQSGLFSQKQDTSQRLLRSCLTTIPAKNRNREIVGAGRGLRTLKCIILRLLGFGSLLKRKSGD